MSKNYIDFEFSCSWFPHSQGQKKWNAKIFFVILYPVLLHTYNLVVPIKSPNVQILLAFFSYLISLFFAKFEENIIIIMGKTFTKLLKPTPYSCYELGHTWNPSCTGSSVEVGLTCLEEAVKIYSSVYFVSYKKIIIVSY